ncbi:hypothetical protein SPBR_09008 [Sporothrix brasiliensis 5110]|uniref:Secreted protein n=1 Tax=Sporothrix brasiliensis 5110 TaxID=1398154 RepID=A0A0C2IPC6_9PEZI|nr:uncharacterized protein SPBR_09008 [Sporothrix brasiliensis 5110]KIH88780.1 hypothetical protein SPBR_09008 [Sporothrix brasiliensis 5110]
MPQPILLASSSFTAILCPISSAHLAPPQQRPCWPCPVKNAGGGTRNEADCAPSRGLDDVGAASLSHPVLADLGPSRGS